MVVLGAMAAGLVLPRVAQADPPQAGAPQALMMTPLGDADRDIRESAVAEVRAILEHQGIVFIAGAPGVSLQCETPECRAAAASQSGAAIAVTVLVWQPTSFRTAGRVEVALTDVSGETVGAEADFVADEVLAAVQAARTAFERFGARARVALEITGSDGAAVLVDGRPAGTLPFRGTLSAGAHRIRVINNGQVVLARELTVEQGGEPIFLRVTPVSTSADAQVAEAAGGQPAGGQPAAAEAAAVESAAVESAAAEGSAASRRARRARLATGLALGVAGAGALVWVAAEAAGAGCDARNEAGECTRRSDLRRGPAVALGLLGAAALAVGVTLVVRARAPGAPQVSVSLGPTNTALHVAF